jgi:hypothetical protein
MVDLDEELRKPPRVNRPVMAVATVLCAVVAIVVGLIFGAWAVLQPYPEPTAGPVSLYVVAAGGFCLAAGRKVGLRSSIMKRGYSDPGWITPGILVVLAAGCMGIWMASLAATGHIPEASVTSSRARGAIPQSQFTPAQQQNLGVFCGTGANINYVACASLATSWAANSIRQYEVLSATCQGYQGLSDPTAQAKLSDCQKQIWGSSIDVKDTSKANVRGACELAQSAAAAAGRSDDPRIQCTPRTWRFVNSPSTSRAGDPS